MHEMHRYTSHIYQTEKKGPCFPHLHHDPHDDHKYAHDAHIRAITIEGYELRPSPKEGYIIRDTSSTTKIPPNL